MEFFETYFPAIATPVLAVLALFAVHHFVLKGHDPASGKQFRNQLIMAILTLFAGIAILAALPIGDELRNQLFSLFGVLLSAAIALSSTTLLGNAMAGIMLRAVRAFRLGEFIRCGDHFGRVSEMGLFHTEIQTEDSDLTTIPNLYIVNNPVKRIRPSGTILSAEVSLGYDVPRTSVEGPLIAAGEKAGLKEPFVRIVELQDHAIVYKVAGLLENVKSLLAARSNLRAAMLDALHGAGVEIVSPGFLNRRDVTGDPSIVPRVEEEPDVSRPRPSSEKVIFDKAEEAESLESLRKTYESLKGKIAEAEAKVDGGVETERLKRQKERLKEVIARKESEANKEE